MARKNIQVPPGVKILHMVPPRLASIQVIAEEKPADPLAPVRVELGDNIAALLADHGYETMDDLTMAFALGDEAELDKIKGIGPKTIEALRALTEQAAGDAE